MISLSRVDAQPRLLRSLTYKPRFSANQQPALPGMEGFLAGPNVKRPPEGLETPVMGTIDELSRIIRLLAQEEDPLARGEKGGLAMVLLDTLRQGVNTLVDQNITDPLTMLYNRRFFDTTLRQVFKDTKASHTKVDGQNPKSCALLMIDVDKFKLVNDDPVWGGHQTGDMALKAIAKQLTNNMRLEDGYVCRYGGEELAVVLPNCDSNKALTIGNRLLNAVPKLTYMNREPRNVHPNSPLYRLAQDRDLSVSIGVAVFNPSMQAEDDLIALADKAAEHAKANGRNQMYMASITPGQTLRYNNNEPLGVEYDLMAHGPSLIWNYTGEMPRHPMPLRLLT